MNENYTHKELQLRIKDLEKEIETHQKEQKELRLFKSIVDASNEAIAITDPSGNLVYINNAHEKLFGRSLEQVGQTSFREYFPEDAIQLLETIVDPALKNGKSWESVVDVYHKDGKPFPLWIRADTITDSDGNQLYAFALMHDITDEKAREIKLKENEEKYRELFNNINTGVAVFEAINNGEDFIFKEFNRAGEYIERINKDSIIGKSVLQIFPGVKAFGLFDVFKRVWQTGIPEELPISFYQDGRISGWSSVVNKKWTFS